STRRTRSPAANTRATPLLPALALECHRGRGGAFPQTAERAHLARRRRAARAARAQRLAFDVHFVAEASVPALEETEEECGLGAGRAVFERVEDVLVAEVAIARRHRALLDLVVDATQHAVRRGLALTQSHERLHLPDEPGRGGEHRVLPSE